MAIIKTSLMKLASKANKTPPTPQGWQQINGLLYKNYGSNPSPLIIGLDMDGTLISTKSGRIFPVHPDDWQLLYDNIPSCIQDYVRRDYRAVIFTNQAGISSGKIQQVDIQYKIDNLVEALGVPVLAMAAVDDSHYRKPCTGMWDFLQSRLNGGIDIDKRNSLYIGDAAGRPAAEGRKKDFNDADFKFAINLGVQFQTPQMFFLDQREQLPTIDFNPSNIKRSGHVFVGAEPGDPVDRAHTEMVIFVGSPGAGKSTFWRNHISHYVRVSNDTLKTRDGCLRAARAALEEGKSCVVDNTNPSAEVRRAYINIAKEFDVPVRAFVFQMPKDLAFHLDTLRLVNVFRQHLSKRVGNMPIHVFYKNFEMPSLEEGFAEVHEVELVAGPFENEEDERMFFGYVHS